jgi:hypothetical protein
MRAKLRPIWRQRTPPLVFALRLMAFVPIMLGCAYLLLWLPPAPAIAVIAATLEAVSFEAVVPEMAQIRLQGFSVAVEAPVNGGNLGFRDTTLTPAASRKPICLAGLLLPEPGSRVTYKRFGTGPVSVTIERNDGRPAARFELAKGDAPPAVRQASWIHLEAQTTSDDSDDDKKKPAGPSCDGDPETRLPIYGIADLGTEIRPSGTGSEQSAGLLIEGTLDIFARTIELSALSESAPRLYPAATGQIALPPGSRITEYVKPGQARQPWVGFVEADADKALEAKVTTPAMRLAIVRPGLGLAPEVISIGLFTQLTNDPVLMMAQVAAAFLFATFEILGSIVGFFSNRTHAHDHGTAEHVAES